MPKRKDTGRNPSNKALREADRIAEMHPLQQQDHPTAVAADPAALTHINSYGEVPDFYIDRPFVCRLCGKREIWKARDQKWYYEVAKGHVDARAVECHACRKARKSGQSNP